MARVILALVGVTYALLAIWCAAQLERTAKALGFTLSPGLAQSEFLVAYGGLQMALGAVFLWPLYAPADTAPALRFCILVHVCLVAFRTLGFARFPVTDSTIYILAGIEWFILALSLLAWWLDKSITTP